MRIPKSLVTILVAAYVVVTSAEAAVAMSEAGRDAPGDVVSRSLTTDATPTKVEPARRLGDIVANSASFGTDLVVTTKFRNLAANGQQQFSWFILTSEDEFNWIAHLLVAPGKDKGRFSLFDPVAYQPDCGKAVLNRPQRTATLTIPASCLRNPEWVKVGNGVFFYTATREYTDDARREGVGRDHWKYGPKLYP